MDKYIAKDVQRTERVLLEPGTLIGFKASLPSSRKVYGPFMVLDHHANGGEWWSPCADGVFKNVDTVPVVTLSNGRVDRVSLGERTRLWSELCPDDRIVQTIEEIKS